MQKYSSKRNGRRGGRPKSENTAIYNPPDITLVILTESQYKTLLEKYGYAIINKALKIMENWLKCSPEGHKYLGKNNYGHFRSDGWVINLAKHNY